MRCGACGTENRPGRKFCSNCGNSLSRACPSCGSAYDEGERFCGECGAALPQAAGAAAAAPQPVVTGAPAEPIRSAERRHVTVLFADLVGFTPLSSQRDAEDVRDLLSRYFETARTVIARYGGVVEKFIGDAVMAAWGVNSVREDDAERAVRAALDLVEAVALFGDQVGAPGLRARAGVLTGEAAVGVEANGEAMVAGDLVNTASRVQSVAEPGSVYVGDSTRQVTEAAIIYEDTGAHELKGKLEPVRLWRAQRVVAAIGGRQRPTGLEPPFVGRDRELRLLKEEFHAASEEGRARLVSIVGVGGVGKSRLGWEFFKYTDGLSELFWWHRGRCLAYGEGVAYWALAEMVRMRAGILENEPPETARDKLRRSVEEFVPEADERRWVEPRLAHLVGLEERVASDPRDLYAAWRFFFERLAAQQLTVLVFEDLQWADSGLLDFIEYLLEWSRNSRILVVTLARPELTERRAGWAAGKRGVTSVYLEPLSTDSMDQLLEGMVPGLPADLKVRIRERAAGVPLYAVETVRMLLDRGLLRERDGSYAVEGSLESLEVPESLHALIAARLDSLSAPERQVLQDASVLGKSFTETALAAVSNVSRDEVAPTLQALVSKDLLSIQSDPRSPERGQYIFVQELVRSVAYGTLARRDRKARHLAAAAYLAGSWSEEEEVVEVVASHLVEAYEADPEADDAAAIRARARDALVKAAEHAASLAAAASAQHYYQRALELADADTQAQLHARAGEMAWMLGNAPVAREHFDQAVALHTAGGHVAAAARLSVPLAALDTHEMKRDVAVERMERAFATLSELAGDDVQEQDLAVVAAELARREHLTGRHQAALQHVELALEIAERLGLWDVFCEAINTKGMILATLGRVEEGSALVECALDRATASDMHAAALRAYNNLAAIIQPVNPLRSEEFAAAGSSLARLVGDRRFEVMLHVGRVPILIDLGRWDEALDVVAGFLESSETWLTESQLSGELTYAIWLYLWRGQLDEAKALLERLSSIQRPNTGYAQLMTTARAAVRRAEGHDTEALNAAREVFLAPLDVDVNSYQARWALAEAAEAAANLGNMTALAQLLDDAGKRFRPGRIPLVDAVVSLYSAVLAAGRGDDAGVAQHSRSAMDAFESLQMPFNLAVARLELGEWLVRRGRRGDAEPLLNNARTTFVHLGATPWIARVDAAVQQTPSSAPVAVPS